MNKYKKSTFECRHEDPNSVIQTPEGERVCRCGTVLEEKMYDEHTHTSQNRVSLYHQVENGGDPRDMKVINKKIHIYTSNTSEFSNICDKLELHEFVKKKAWYIYRLFRRRTYHTKAKCAAFAVYIACRDNGQPVDEQQIRDVVGSALCVKRVPNMLNVISELHDDALHLGIDTNLGHSSKYYLNMAISKKQSLFGNPTDYDRFKAGVIDTFGLLGGNNQNKASRAVDIVLCEMGMI